MKIPIASTLVLLSSFFPSGNTTPDRIVVDGLVTFEQTFESSLAQNELMLKSKAWIEKKYEVLKDPVQLQDDENGIIVARGVDVYLYEVVLKDAPKRKNRETQNNSSMIRFQLTIEAKDNEIKLVMNEIRNGGKVQTPYRDEMQDLTKSDEIRNIESKIHQIFSSFSAVLEKEM